MDNATAEDIETEKEAKALLAYQELVQEIRGLEEESRAADAEAGKLTDEDRKQEANEAEYRRMERLDSLYAERRKAENGKVLREMARRISGEESAEGTAGRTKEALTAEEEDRLLREKLADRLISKAVETRDDNADTRRALISYLKGADITLPAANRLIFRVSNKKLKAKKYAVKLHF